jgi:hypothetical protein
LEGFVRKYPRRGETGYVKYTELGKVPAELFNQLFHKLPPEDREILDQYNSGRMAQMDREDEILYSRGLMDGIWLCRWIERVGSGEEVLK